MPLHVEISKKRSGPRGDGGITLTADENDFLEKLLLKYIVFLFVVLDALMDPVCRDNQLAFRNIDNRK